MICARCDRPAEPYYPLKRIEKDSASAGGSEMYIHTGKCPPRTPIRDTYRKERRPRRPRV